MGLLRGMARTAVVAGTATAVSNRVSRRQYGRWAEQDVAEAGEPQQVVAPPPAPPRPEDRIAQLTELGKLKDSGVLTDAEFASEKGKILNT
jgi:Short C-terminal domain